MMNKFISSKKSKTEMVRTGNGRSYSSRKSIGYHSKSSKSLISTSINPLAKGFNYRNGGVICYRCSSTLILTTCKKCILYYAKYDSHPDEFCFDIGITNNITKLEDSSRNSLCPGEHNNGELYMFCSKCDLYYLICSHCSDISLNKLYNDAQINVYHQLKTILKNIEKGSYKIQLSKFLGFHTPSLLKSHYVICQEDQKTHKKTYLFPEYRPNKSPTFNCKLFQTIKEYYLYQKDYKKIVKNKVCYSTLPEIITNKYSDETFEYHYINYYLGDKEQLFARLKKYFHPDNTNFDQCWNKKYQDQIVTDLHWHCMRCNLFYQYQLKSELIEKYKI